MTAAIYTLPVHAGDGTTTTLEPYRDQLLLVVNTASRCGLTPQYGQLQELLTRYAHRGLTVVAFPCNQFNGQEPGTDAQIQEFCSMTYGVDFPVFAKIEVNGPDRHPIYQQLTASADLDGISGDVQWNFEKFLIAPGGEIVARVRPRVEPLQDHVLTLIEQHLPARLEASR